MESNIKIQEIRCSDISEDKPYFYHFYTYDKFLSESIKMQGILTPLWLIENNDMIIIDGYRRFCAACENHITTIPAIIFNPDGLEKTFLRGLHVNLIGEKLSLLEKFRAYQIAITNFSEEMIKMLSELLELQRIPDIGKTAMEVLTSPGWFQEYLHKFDMPLKIIRKLNRYSKKEYQDWFEMAVKLNFKGRETISLLEKIEDVLIRDKVDAERLWHLLNIDDILRSNWTSPQKVQHVKARVDEIRYPMMKKIEKRMSLYKSELEKRFSGHMKIDWDKSLEKPEIMVNIQISSASMADKIFEKIGNEDTLKALKKIILVMDELPAGDNRDSFISH